MHSLGQVHGRILVKLRDELACIVCEAHNTGNGLITNSIEYEANGSFLV